MKTEEGEIIFVKIKEEDMPLQISMDGQYTWNFAKEHEASSPNGEREDGGLTVGTQSATNSSSALHPGDQLFDLSTYKKGLSTCSLTVALRKRARQFICAQCGKCCTKKADLIKHERVHTGEKPYSCSRCGKCFSHKSDLIKHERIHNGQKPYSCPLCGKSFSQKTHLIKHERVHTGEKPFSCSICGKHFSCKSYGIIHERNHIGKKAYICSECGKRFTKQSDLFKHEKVHKASPTECLSTQNTSPQLQPADLPSNASTDRHCLPDHSHPVTQPTKGKPCFECGKTFTNESDLMKHAKSHRTHFIEAPIAPNLHPALHLADLSSDPSTDDRLHTVSFNRGEKSHVCSECGKGFTKRSELIKHERVHTGERPYSCSECGKCFSLKSGLIKHTRIHSGEKPYSCSICGKCFSQKTHLLKHKSVHTGEKPFSCTVCRKRFSCKSYGVIHERSHSVVTPYFCSICGNYFSKESTLNKHKVFHTGESTKDLTFALTHPRLYPADLVSDPSIDGNLFPDCADPLNHHTGEKLYSCSECGKCCSKKSDLIKHERVHTGERPYSCSICEKSFSHKSDLIKHERVHTGEKPYVCLQCGKRFSQKAHLIKHCRIHAGEEGLIVL